MRRIVTALVLVSATALLAAAPRPPAPKPTASPLPAPAATPGRPVLPIVVVYPFQVSTDLQSDSGVRAAQLFVSQMNAAGGVDAIAAPNTIKRSDYLKYAESINADYYVTGYMTPLGGGVSLVEQLVSTMSGAIAFGTTAQIQTFEDAAAQAVAIRDDIVAREESAHTELAQAEAQSTPAPIAKNQANLSGSIANLFRRRGSQNSNSTSATVKPSKGIFVARIAGSLPPNQLAEANSALYHALDQRFVVHPSGASGDVSKAADAICGAQRNNTVGTGVLSVTSTRRTFSTRTQYRFVFTVYTCFGAKLAESSGQGDSIPAAVNAAVAAYAADHPANG